jgi:hypothetical protein
MIRTFRKAADPADLRALTPTNDTLILNVLRGTLPLSLAVSGVTYLISRSLMVAGSVGALLFAASLTSNLRFFRGVARRKESTEADAVEVIEVEASRIFDIQHLGSHGPAYVFFGADGKALLLIGQWLLEQRKFPARSFRLHRWTDTGEPIRIESTGGRMKPEQSAVVVPSTGRVPDIAIFDATPETLQDDLDRLTHAG